MQDLARGWAIVMAHWNSHHLADMIALWTALGAGVWLPIWVALREPDRKNSDDANLRPKQRAPLPRPDRGFRS